MALRNLRQENLKSRARLSYRVRPYLKTPKAGAWVECLSSTIKFPGRIPSTQKSVFSTGAVPPRCFLSTGSSHGPEPVGVEANYTYSANEPRNHEHEHVSQQH